MKFINKMERKFGRYAIKNLMKYVIGLYIAGIVIFMINPLYYQYLSLDFDMIRRGQIWRFVTFLIQPIDRIDFFILFALYLYYMIGTALEDAWGSFRFNLYFFSGVLFNILAGFILYKIIGVSFPIPLSYINQAMFFAFALLYPDVPLMLFFILPIKVKYLGIIYAVLFGYDVYDCISSGAWWYAAVMLVSIANFLIFFLLTRNYRRFSPQQVKRRANFKRQVRNAHNPDNVILFPGKTKGSRHKCAVCGRTEFDDDSLEFRFCSKCDGNYEYCMDHLYTHEHVHKDSAHSDSSHTSV